MDRAGLEGRPHLIRKQFLWLQRGRLDGPSALLVAGVVATLLIDWPVQSLVPDVGLDSSWHMVIQMWGHGLPGQGPQVDFTLGPLGFLYLPTLWWGLPCALAWLTTLLTVVSFAYVVITRVRTSLPSVAAVLVALLVIRGMYVDGGPAVWPLVAWLWAVDARFRSDSQRLIAAMVLGGIADVLLLAKFGDGLVMIGVALGAPLLWSRRPWRELAAVVVVLTVGFFALWSLVTLAPGGFLHYLRASMQLANGYWAMSLPGGIGYLVGALVLATLLLLLALTSGGGPRAYWLAGLTGWVLWLDLKHAFLRAGPGHIPSFFLAVSVMALAAGLARERYGHLLRGAVALAAFTLMVVSAGPGRSVFVHASGPRELLGQAHALVTTSVRNSIEASGRSAIVTGYQVPAAMISAIGRGTVQVDPYDTEVAWAYHLRLRPVPVFQLYSAYTSELDQENVRALSGRRSPDFVLRRLTAVGIDGRFAAWESPAYQVELICRYTEILRIGGWQLLERAPVSRCGRPQPLATESLDREVTTPTAPAGSLVVASFDVTPSMTDRLRRFVFRQVPPPVVIDGQAYPFLAGVAKDLHLIDAPADAPVGPTGEVRLTVKTMRFSGSPAHGTVTFWSIPFAPA